MEEYTQPAQSLWRPSLSLTYSGLSPFLISIPLFSTLSSGAQQAAGLPFALASDWIQPAHSRNTQGSWDINTPLPSRPTWLLQGTASP